MCYTDRTPCFYPRSKVYYKRGSGKVHVAMIFFEKIRESVPPCRRSEIYANLNVGAAYVLAGSFASE